MYLNVYEVEQNNRARLAEEQRRAARERAVRQALPQRNNALAAAAVARLVALPRRLRARLSRARVPAAAG